MTICPCCNRPIEGGEGPPPNIEEQFGGYIQRGIVRILRENYPRRVRMYKLASAVYGTRRYDMEDPAKSLVVTMHKMRKVMPEKTGGWTISNSGHMGYKLERADGN